jgi:hypothetical protein
LTSVIRLSCCSLFVEVLYRFSNCHSHQQSSQYLVVHRFYSVVKIQKRESTFYRSILGTNQYPIQKNNKMMKPNVNSMMFFLLLLFGSIQFVLIEKIGSRSSVSSIKPPESSNKPHYLSIESIEARNKNRSLMNENFRITRILETPETFLLENTCYDTLNQYAYIFTEIDTDLFSFGKSLGIKIKFYQKPVESWKKYIFDRKYPFIQNQTVLYFRNQEQPAHCLHNYLFSAFGVNKEGTQIDSYFAINSHHPKECSPITDWCCFAFLTSKLIHIHNQLPNYTQQQFVCFEKLLFLKIGVGR